jgi:predicted protein tyrosine phosphatase
MAKRSAATVIDCNWVPLANGRLTLWHRPGAKAIAALTSFGCSCVVTLLSQAEGAHAIGSSIRQDGLEWFWLPLEDAKPPQAAVSAGILLALPAIWRRLDAGQSVLIHCSAGIHRTGMVAYALLRWYGYGEQDAVAPIGKMRLQTQEGVQRRHVDWAHDVIPLGYLHRQ